jgi:hypothetical protein
MSERLRYFLTVLFFAAISVERTSAFSTLAPQPMLKVPKAFQALIPKVPPQAPPICDQYTSGEFSEFFAISAIPQCYNVSGGLSVLSETTDLARYQKLSEICKCYLDNKGTSTTAIVMAQEMSPEAEKEKEAQRVQAVSSQFSDLLTTIQVGPAFQASLMNPGDKSESPMFSTTRFSLNVAGGLASKEIASAFSVFDRLTKSASSLRNKNREAPRAPTAQETFKSMLVNKTPGSCIPLRQYLSLQQIEEEKKFYHDFGKETYSPQNWNMNSLMKELGTIVTSSGKKSLEEVKAKDPRAAEIVKRMDYLMAHPVYMNIFGSSDPKPEVEDAKEALFAHLKSNFPSSQCPSENMECLVKRAEDTRKADLEFFKGNEIYQNIANEQGEKFYNSLMDSLTKNGKELMARPDSVPTLNKSGDSSLAGVYGLLNPPALSGSLEKQKKQIVDSCLDVKAYIGQSHLDANLLVRGELLREWSSKFSMNPALNENYKKKVEDFCHTPRFSKDGKKQMIYPDFEKQYLARKQCISTEDPKCKPEEILKNFQQNYPSNIQGVQDGKELIQAGQSKAVNGFTEDTAAIAATTEVMSVSRVRDLQRNFDYDSLYKENPDIFGSGAPTGPTSKLSSGQTSTFEPQVSSSLPSAMADPTMMPSVLPTMASAAAAPLDTPKPVAKDEPTLPAEGPRTQPLPSETSDSQKVLESRLESLEKELAQKNESTSNKDYKKILEELEALKAEKKAKEETESKVAETNQAAANFARSPASVANLNNNQAPQPNAAPPQTAANQIASVSGNIQSSSGFSSAIGSSSLGSSSAVGIQKALNDKYKVSSSAGIVVVREGEFNGKSNAAVETKSNGDGTYSLSVSEELYTALASTDPTKAQTSIQKELENEFKNLASKASGSIVTIISSTSSTPLKFKIMKVNNQVYFEPIRSAMLKDLQNLTRQ